MLLNSGAELCPAAGEAKPVPRYRRSRGTRRYLWLAAVLLVLLLTVSLLAWAPERSRPLKALFVIALDGPTGELCLHDAPALSPHRFVMRES